MFKQKFIAIIDVGSEDIAVYIGNIDNNKNFHVKSSTEFAYDGFQDGNWLNFIGLREDIKAAVSKAIVNLNCKISAIYIGVPGEFTAISIRDSNTSFGSLHKVTGVDVDRLYDDNDDVSGHGFTSINFSTIYYTIDGKKRTVDPIGMSVRSLELKASYILCRDDFINVFNNALLQFCKVIKFISTPWAECISLFSADVRDQGAVLIDVGYITTDVSYIVGDGLCGLGSFSIGGGHITYDLSYGLEIPYETARYVKTKIDYMIESSKDKPIVVVLDNGERHLDSSYASMITEYRIEEICENITAEIAKFSVKCPKYLKVYLTGGGLTDIRGVRSILSKKLDRVCDLKVSTISNCMNKPYMSSVSGLIQVVSNYDKSRQGFFASFFNLK